jgi:hypothetical protein
MGETLEELELVSLPSIEKAERLFRDIEYDDEHPEHWIKTIVF